MKTNRKCFFHAIETAAVEFWISGLSHILRRFLIIAVVQHTDATDYRIVHQVCSNFSRMPRTHMLDLNRIRTVWNCCDFICEIYVMCRTLASTLETTINAQINAHSRWHASPLFRLRQYYICFDACILLHGWSVKIMNSFVILFHFDARKSEHADFRFSRGTMEITN